MNHFMKNYVFIKIPNPKNKYEMNKWKEYCKTKEYKIYKKIQSIRLGRSPKYRIGNSDCYWSTKFPNAASEINFPRIAFGTNRKISVDDAIELGMRSIIIECEESNVFFFYEIGD